MYAVSSARREDETRANIFVINAFQPQAHIITTNSLLEMGNPRRTGGKERDTESNKELETGTGSAHALMRSCGRAWKGMSMDPHITFHSGADSHDTWPGPLHRPNGLMDEGCLERRSEWLLQGSCQLMMRWEG